MLTIGDLKIKYSGGTSNVSPPLSLGGAMSTDPAAEVIFQNFTPATTVTGVTIINASDNPLGAGSLQFNISGNYLYWKPFGGSSYDGVIISGDGEYTLGTPGGYLFVSVVAASLPVSTTTQTVTISSATSRIFDNISALESLQGAVEYRCLYLENSNVINSAYDVRIWIQNQCSGADSIAISLDSLGLNGGALGPLADSEDSTSVLATLPWSLVSNQATALVIGDMTPGDTHSFWIRRTVPSANTVQTLNDTFDIWVSALLA